MTRTATWIADRSESAMRSRLRKRFALKLESKSERTMKLLDTAEGISLRNGLLLANEGNDLNAYQFQGYIDLDRSAGYSRVGAPPLFWQDMEEGALRDSLRELLDLRAVFAFAKIHLTESKILVRNDDGKTVARWKQTEIESIDEQGNQERLGGICAISCLLGYEKEFEKTLELLEHSDCKNTGFKDLIEKLWNKRSTKRYGYGSRANVDLHYSDTCGKSVVEMIKELMALARSNEAGIIDDIDTEFLHDYRVCIRKIRSLLSLVKEVFSEKETLKLKNDFSALGSRTNRLRDLDVYLLEKEDYVSKLPESLRPGIEKLFKSLAKERGAQQRSIARYLNSKTYNSKIDKLQSRFETSNTLGSGPAFNKPIGEVISSIALARYRKVSKIGSRIDDTTPDEKVHQLRLQCKKLRYAIELFAPLFDTSGIRKLTKRLRRLQNVLGAFNDCSVQQENLLQLLSENESESPALTASIGGLISVLDLKQKECRAKVQDRFEEFNQPSTRDLVEQLFGTGGRS